MAGESGYAREMVAAALATAQERAEMRYRFSYHGDVLHHPGGAAHRPQSS